MLSNSYSNIFLASPDPFAVITVDGEQTHTTLSDKGTIDPFWNTLCRFVVFENSVISIQIFDQKKFKKESIHGKIYIKIINIFGNLKEVLY